MRLQLYSINLEEERKEEEKGRVESFTSVVGGSFLV